MWEFMNLERFIIWIALGIFICYKRNWYRVETDINLPPDGETPAEVCCFFAVVFMPINFLIVFTKVFFINKWR